MTLIERLGRWHASGKISPEQYQLLAAVTRRDRFSLFFELNALLYLGVLSFVAGLGWTVKVHFQSLGDIAILLTLSVLVLGSLGYCFYQAVPFSSGEVESPHLAFDYVLYLACLALSVELGYIETRYHILNHSWDSYLLMSGMVYLILAYRFDNRFVLSLALSTLATWFGVKWSFDYAFRSFDRTSLLIYGLGVLATGVLTQHRGIKKHFLQTYLHIAAHALLCATLSGLFLPAQMFIWLPTFFAFVTVSAVYGVRTRQFAFLSYAILYGYIGFSYLVGKYVLPNDITFYLLYYVFSGVITVISLVLLSRRWSKPA